MRGIWAALAAAAIGAFALASCETMSAEECKVADWRALGFADGSGGNSNFQSRQESCARRGFGADFAAYQAGNAEGIRRYCSYPPNGFQRGLSGAGYNGFCPPDLGGEFAAAHADGYRAYQVRTALSAAESERQRLENRRNEIDNDIRENEDHLRAATTDDERGRIRNELGALNDERRRVNDDIRTQLREIRLRTDAVDQLRYELGDRWGPW